MKSLRKASFMRAMAYLPFLLLLFMLQAAFLPRFPVFGVKAHLLPLVVAASAVCGGVTAGGITGLFAGMLTDISFNEPTIVFTLVFCFLGLFIGYLCQTFLTKGIMVYTLMAVLALAVSGITELVRPVIFAGAALLPLLNVALFEAVFSFVFAYPIFFITRAIERID